MEGNDWQEKQNVKEGRKEEMGKNKKRRESPRDIPLCTSSHCR